MEVKLLEWFACQETLPLATSSSVLKSNQFQLRPNKRKPHRSQTKFTAPKVHLALYLETTSLSPQAWHQQVVQWDVVRPKRSPGRGRWPQGRAVPGRQQSLHVGPRTFPQPPCSSHPPPCSLCAHRVPWASLPPAFTFQSSFLSLCRYAGVSPFCGDGRGAPGARPHAQPRWEVGIQDAGNWLWSSHARSMDPGPRLPRWRPTSPSLGSPLCLQMLPPDGAKPCSSSQPFPTIRGV